MRQALLAGHLPGRVSEPMLCVCHGVAAGAVRAAIAAGASTLTEIGAATRAGTGCGSCKPELRQILAARAREVVVA